VPAWLVVNHGQQDYDRDNRFRSLSRDISLKYSHALRS
jgi:hypothetical protein